MLLETESLTKQFGGLVAVDDVDYQLEAGSVTSLIGPNGAGKTTFFNLLTGALEPTRGTVVFDGEDITDLSMEATTRRGMARSYQITNLFPELTVEENLRIAAQSIGGGNFQFYRRHEAHTAYYETARELLDRLDIAQYADQKAKNLAYGDKRVLEVGIALATDPKLLLLDEPTAGMSKDGSERIIDLISDLRGEYTILLVEHDVEMVMSVSDTVTVLDRGALIARGPPEEIQHDERVREAYLGSEVDE
ncbi:MAG: ABC transporter ATP-binding protein [Haloarculaceae archaeon]